MRRLVGMLRNDGEELLAPQPKLADLPALAIHVGSAGLPVGLDIEGDQRELPAGIEPAAYRIIQEALTNAVKHAGGATATVHVVRGLSNPEIRDELVISEATAKTPRFPHPAKAGAS